MAVSDDLLVTLGDWDHYLSDDEWRAVSKRADEIAVARGFGVSPTARALVAPVVTVKYADYPNSPNDKSGTLRRRQLWVVHTAECPLKVGYAQSMTEWADGDTYTPRVSWHRFVDPATVARFIPLGEAAWHATWANPFSIGYEQSGYARFVRADWLTPLGLAQISNLARQMVVDGIPAAAARRLSNDDVNAVKGGNTTITGLCSHAQINPDTRTDPGAGYPWDVLVDFIWQYHPELDSPEEGIVADLTRVNSQQVWTSYDIVKDTRSATPDTAPRVTPSTLLEDTPIQTRAIQKAIVALDKKVTDLATKVGETPPPLDPSKAEEVLREEVRAWLAKFTISQA